MIGGVKLAGHKARSQAAERSADLVAARREPLAGHGKDAARHAGQAGGDLDIVRNLLIQTAALLGLVVPGNAEEVHGVNVPQTGLCELVLDLFRNQIGILHLGDGRDDDMVFLGLLDVVLQAFLVDAKINHGFLLLFLHQDMSTACIWIYQNAFAILSPDFVMSSAPFWLRKRMALTLSSFVIKATGFANQLDRLRDQVVQQIAYIKRNPFGFLLGDVLREISSWIECSIMDSAEMSKLIQKIAPTSPLSSLI